ncbi:MAG: MBL fold metallo-hydrolase [Promethearchaeota archaeon]
MKVSFLGTNGWYSTDQGNTVCIFISTEKFDIILDAGDGLYKIDKYIKGDKPIIILLSHIHLDHIIGLHVLSKFRFQSEINIYGYNGIKKSLISLLDHPYSSPLSKIPLKISINELIEGIVKTPFDLTCYLLEHSDPCLGYRIEIEEKVITYCTDTGMCDNLYKLADEADILITECSYKSGQEQWGWPHLKPEEAAEVAFKSKVKKLILTHFDASIYLKSESRKEAEIKARKIFPNTISAYDNLSVDL